MSGNAPASIWRLKVLAAAADNQKYEPLSERLCLVKGRYAPRRMASQFRFDAEAWLSPGDAGWHFVTLPTDLADEIRARSEGRPFGSVPVTVTVGATSWETSLFADTKSASYLLPLKADARRRERIVAGDRVTVTVELRG
jgi:hypothetical protein